MVDPGGPSELDKFLGLLLYFHVRREVLVLILLHDLVVFCFDIMIGIDGEGSSLAVVAEAQFFHAFVADHYLRILSLKILNFHHVQIRHLGHLCCNVDRRPASQRVLASGLLHIRYQVQF